MKKCTPEGLKRWKYKRKQINKSVHQKVKKTKEHANVFNFFQSVAHHWDPQMASFWGEIHVFHKVVIFWFPSLLFDLNQRKSPREVWHHDLALYWIWPSKRFGNFMEPLLQFLKDEWCQQQSQNWNWSSPKQCFTLSVPFCVLTCRLFQKKYY